jgi:hypothetical protein
MSHGRAPPSPASGTGAYGARSLTPAAAAQLSAEIEALVERLSGGADAAARLASLQSALAALVHELWPGAACVLSRLRAVR